MRGRFAFLLLGASAILYAMPATTNAATVDVFKSFDFSSNPVTLTPFDPSVAQTLIAGQQYITLNVDFGRQIHFIF